MTDQTTVCTPAEAGWVWHPTPAGADLRTPSGVITGYIRRETGWHLEAETVKAQAEAPWTTGDGFGIVKTFTGPDATRRAKAWVEAQDFRITPTRPGGDDTDSGGGQLDAALARVGYEILKSGRTAEDWLSSAYGDLWGGERPTVRLIAARYGLTADGLIEEAVKVIGTGERG